MTEEKQELYISTIESLKSQFMMVGWGDGQAIKRDLLERYIDIYPFKLTGVILYLDYVEIQTDVMTVKISNRAELHSDHNSDPDNKSQAEQIARSALHQLSLMLPLYVSRTWLKEYNDGRKELDPTLGALNYMATDKRFI